MRIASTEKRKSISWSSNYWTNTFLFVALPLHKEFQPFPAEVLLTIHIRIDLAERQQYSAILPENVVPRIYEKSLQYPGTLQITQMLLQTKGHILINRRMISTALQLHVIYVIHA